MTMIGCDLIRLFRKVRQGTEALVCADLLNMEHEVMSAGWEIGYSKSRLMKCPKELRNGPERN